MARIPDHAIEQLKSDVSLQRLVDAHGITLKPHGQDLLGTCPFHDDATPSLVINTDSSFFLSSEAHASKVSKGASIIIRYPGLSRSMKITVGEKTWSYDFTSVVISREYIKPQFMGFSANKIMFQVESNGAVYIFKPDVTMPSKILPPQPSGFPMIP